MSFNTWSIILLSAYILVLLYLGFYSLKQVSNSTDFATGGGKISPFILGVALAATIHSSGTFVGNGGLGYSFGFSVLWHAITIPIPVVISLVLFSKKVHKVSSRFQSVSLADWVGHRYKSDGVRIALAVCTFSMIITIFAQYVGAATAFEGALNISYYLGLVLAVVIVSIYTLFGGFISAAYTDLIQGIIMLVAAVAIFFSAFWVFKGGIGEVNSILQSIDPNLTKTVNPTNPLFGNAPYIIIMFLIYMTHMTEPQNINKIFAVGETKKLRTFIIVFSVFMIGMSMADMGGIYMRALSKTVPIPDNFRPDQANFLYIQHAFPPFFSAFFNVAILGAIMSTMSGLLVSLSVAASNDIYRRVLVPKGITGLRADATEDEIEKRSVLIGRLATLLAGVLTLIAMRTPPQYLNILMLAGRGALGAASVGPVILGLFWRRGNSQGALAAIITGAVSFILIYFVFNLEKNPTAAQFYSTVLSLIVMIVVSLLTTPLPKEYIDGVFGKDTAA